MSKRQDGINRWNVRYSQLTAAQMKEIRERAKLWLAMKGRSPEKTKQKRLRHNQKARQKAAEFRRLAVLADLFQPL